MSSRIFAPMIMGLCSDNLSGIMLLTFGPNWANIQIIMQNKKLSYWWVMTSVTIRSLKAVDRLILTNLKYPRETNVGWMDHSRSSKVNADVAQWKVRCDFLLVIYSNIASDFNSFRNIAVDRCKIVSFSVSSSIYQHPGKIFVNIFAIF